MAERLRCPVAERHAAASADEAIQSHGRRQPELHARMCQHEVDELRHRAWRDHESEFAADPER
jgi:peptide deformylase